MGAPQVRVGVGVFVQHPDGRILLGKRKGSHGAGEWSLPGGHVEWGETVEHAAAREVLEETGLTVENVHKLWYGDYFCTEKDLHYVTLFLTAEVCCDPELLRTVEPDKCEGWEWFDDKSLPAPLFGLIAQAYDEFYGARYYRE